MNLFSVPAGRTAKWFVFWSRAAQSIRDRAGGAGGGLRVKVTVRSPAP